MSTQIKPSVCDAVRQHDRVLYEGLLTETQFVILYHKAQFIVKIFSCINKVSPRDNNCEKSHKILRDTVHPNMTRRE